VIGRPEGAAAAFPSSSSSSAGPQKQQLHPHLPLVQWVWRYFTGQHAPTRHMVQCRRPPPAPRTHPEGEQQQQQQQQRTAGAAGASSSSSLFSSQDPAAAGPGRAGAIGAGAIGAGAIGAGAIGAGPGVPGVVLTGLPPLLFQHDGHSRTIVGIERRPGTAAAAASGPAAGAGGVRGASRGGPTDKAFLPRGPAEKITSYFSRVTPLKADQQQERQQSAPSLPAAAAAGAGPGPPVISLDTEDDLSPKRQRVEPPCPPSSPPPHPPPAAQQQQQQQSPCSLEESKDDNDDGRGGDGYTYTLLVLDPGTQSTALREALRWEGGQCWNPPFPLASFDPLLMPCPSPPPSSTSLLTALGPGGRGCCAGACTLSPATSTSWCMCLTRSSRPGRGTRSSC
jgi:hypothetical protein